MELNAPTLSIAPPSLLSDHVKALIKEARAQARGKDPKRRIRVRERRGRKQLTGRRKTETEMMRETVGERRRIILILQAAKEDATAAVVAIATRLALRDPGQ